MTPVTTTTLSHVAADAPVAAAPQGSRETSPEQRGPCSTRTARKLGINIWLRDQTTLTVHQRSVALLLIAEITEHGGCWDGSIGTLAANVPTSISTLEDCLRECIRTGLIERLPWQRQMFRYRLGPTLQGEQLQALVEAGWSEAAYQSGMNCKGNSQGEWNREYPTSWHRAQTSRRPTVAVAAEPVAGPTRPSTDDLRPVDGGTGNPLGNREVTSTVSSTVSSTVTNSMVTVTSTVTVNSKETAAVNSMSEHSLSSDEIHPTAVDVATVSPDPPSSIRAVALLSDGGTPQPKLINGLSNPLNVEAGDTVLWRNTSCTVLNGYCWERDAYWINHPVDGHAWVEAALLTTTNHSSAEGVDTRFARVNA